MKLHFHSTRIEKRCDNALREYGDQIGKKLLQRLKELHAFVTLADIPHVPPHRRHMLTGDRKGQFAVDVKDGYRVVFVPCGEFQAKADGSVDMKTVTEITILNVEDYHA